MAHQSAVIPVLKAVGAALNVAAFTGVISGKTVTVTNGVSQTTAVPYAATQLATETRFDRMGSPGKNVLIELHFFSEAGTDAELGAMHSKAVELLHYVALTIDAHTIVRPGGELEEAIDMGADEIAGRKRRHWLALYRIEVVQTTP